MISNNRRIGEKFSTATTSASNSEVGQNSFESSRSTTHLVRFACAQVARGEGFPTPELIWSSFGMQSTAFYRCLLAILDRPCDAIDPVTRNLLRRTCRSRLRLATRIQI